MRLSARGDAFQAERVRASPRGQGTLGGKQCRRRQEGRTQTEPFQKRICEGQVPQGQGIHRCDGHLGPCIAVSKPSQSSSVASQQPSMASGAHIKAPVILSRSKPKVGYEQLNATGSTCVTEWCTGAWPCGHVLHEATGEVLPMSPVPLHLQSDPMVVPGSVSIISRLDAP